MAMYVFTPRQAAQEVARLLIKAGCTFAPKEPSVSYVMQQLHFMLPFIRDEDAAQFSARAAKMVKRIAKTIKADPNPAISLPLRLPLMAESAVYEDQAGCFVRAIAAYDIEKDKLFLRCDIIIGRKAQMSEQSAVYEDQAGCLRSRICRL